MDRAPMPGRPDYRRTVQLRPSWRMHALNALLRLTMRRRITLESAVAALRREYEEIDARYFEVAHDVTRTTIECGGMPAEWIGVPHAFQMAQFLPEATLAIHHIARFVRMRTGWDDTGA